MEKKREESILCTFMENGLVLDTEKRDALSFLELVTDDDISQYSSRYGIENISGELCFVPGTTFSRIKSDILFGRELGNLVISSTSVLLFDMERKVVELDDEYYYPLGRRTLEDIWFDYDTKYSPSLKVRLSALYNMDEETFSGLLDNIAYASQMAVEGRKIVDYIFPDMEKTPSPFMRSDMIAFTLLSTENMLLYSMRPLSFKIIDELDTLLKRYDIAPGRVGLIDRREN